MSAPKEKRMRMSTFMDMNPGNTSSRLSIIKAASSRRARSSIIPQYTLEIANDNACETLVNEDDQADALIEYILQSQWNVCRVSPLNNFKYLPTKFKQYASKILDAVSKSDPDTEYKVEIQVVNNLKLETKHSDALQICIIGFNNDSSKVVYTGFLFSWGFHAAKHENNVTHLPLLLDNGAAKVFNTVRQVLMKLFDCVVTPLHFNQTELLFLSMLLGKFVQSDSAKTVTFVYNVPYTSIKTQFEVTMTADSIYNMWFSCFPKDTSILDEQCSQKWNTAFRYHVAYVYEVDISRLELVELKYPNMNVKNKGRILMRDLEVTKHMLKILCEMSVILKGSTPKLVSDYY